MEGFIIDKFAFHGLEFLFYLINIYILAYEISEEFTFIGSPFIFYDNYEESFVSISHIFVCVLNPKRDWNRFSLTSVISVPFLNEILLIFLEYLPLSTRIHSIYQMTYVYFIIESKMLVESADSVYYYIFRLLGDSF